LLGEERRILQMEPETAPKLKVLVVDDSQSMREFLTTLLSLEGHRCELAATGREAVEKVKQAHFGVVITDVHMLEMDGITLTRELTLRFPDLPVIVMTGQPDDSLLESAISAGAREVLGRSFAISDFAVRLQRMLHA
jgi:CheY-like chemotaxis protein